MSNQQNTLSTAVCGSRISEIKDCLAAGASIEGVDDNGDTPLVVAVEHQVDGEILKFLLSFGADVNRRAKDGVTALHVAIDRALDMFIHEHDNYINDTHIRILLEAGADPEIADDNGRSAIDWARAYLPAAAGIMGELERTAKRKRKGGGGLF